MIKDNKGRQCVWGTIIKDDKKISVLVPHKYYMEYFVLVDEAKRNGNEYPLSEDYEKWIEGINQKYPKGTFTDLMGGKDKRNRFLIMCLVILGVIVGLTIMPKNQSTSSSSKNSSLENSAWDGSVKVVKDYLKKNLKDPDSYESIEWGPVSPSIVEGAEYFVRHKYRAKNSFGGFVIENQYFHYNENGIIVKVVDIK